MLKTLLFHLIFSFLVLETFSQSSPKTDLEQTYKFRMTLPFKLCKIFDKEEDEPEYVRAASDNENVYLVSSNGKLKSLGSNRQVNWIIDLGGQVMQKPYVFNDNILVISEIENVSENRNVFVVRLLYKGNGIVKWQLELDSQKINGRDNEIYINHSGNKLFIVTKTGDLYSINTSEGKITAKKSLGSVLTAVPFFDKKRIILGTADKQIIQILNESLTEVGRIGVPEAPSVVYPFGNRLVYGNIKGKLTGLECSFDSPNPKSKRKWVLRVGGGISDIIPMNDGFLITSLDNYIYRISVDSGEIIWKQRLANRPIFTPLLIEDYIVVSTIGESPVLVIESKSGRIINRINISEENFLSDDVGKIFPFIYFPTNQGVLFYTSGSTCH